MSHLRIMTSVHEHDLSGIMRVCCIAEYYMLNKHVQYEPSLGNATSHHCVCLFKYDHVKTMTEATSLRPNLLRESNLSPRWKGIYQYVSIHTTYW